MTRRCRNIRIFRDNQLWWNVSSLSDLFFYTLYGFKAYFVYGTINNRAAKETKRITGIDVLNYKIELNSNHLKHFLYSHFHERNKKQRGVHFSDIECLKDVIDNFGHVEFGNKTNSLLYERKNPDGSTFVLVVMIDKTKKVLSGKSFRVKT